MASTAVVVGAGPAGCLVSSLLASRGWKVEVFERRSAPQPAESKGPRGYPVRLTDRSLNRIEAAGLKLDSTGPNAALSQRIIINGNFMLELPYTSYMVDRTQLGLEMYKAAAAQHHSGSITWHWNQALHEVDFNSRKAFFADTTEDSSSQGPMQYDLLIGADGYQSTVRSALEKAIPQQMTAYPLFASDVTYKTYHGLPAEWLVPQVPDMVSQKPRENLMVFSEFGHPIMLAIWKTDDGTLSGVLSGEVTYEEEAIRDIAKKRLAGCPKELIDSIVSQTKEGGGQAPSRFGQIVKLSQLHGPRCVLLGDAGHCVTSNLAQGCNMALEGVGMFIDTLDRLGVDAAPAAYTRARLPDVHAMQTMEFMSSMNFVAIAKQPQLIKGTVRLPNLFERLSSLLLMVVVPQIQAKLPQFLTDYRIAINDASKPYSQVLGSMQATAGVLGACALGLLAVGVGLAARAVLPA